MAVKTRAKAQSKSQPKDESSSLLNNALGQIEKAFGVGSIRGLVRGLARRYYPRIEITGGDRIPHTGPVLLCANHANSLLAQRHLVDDAHHCVHGRPTALILNQHELDRQFGRLG